MFKKLTLEEQLKTDRQHGLLFFGNNREDINDIALTSAFILEDSMTTAEMVGYLLIEIEQLNSRIISLEGGK